MAASIAHDSLLQEANTVYLFCLLNVKGVTSLGRHTRPVCHPGSTRDVLIKKVDVDLYTVCFFLTLGMRGVWGYFS